MNALLREKKRHIIFFIDSLYGGGAERVCALLANSFATRNYKVTLVTIKASHATDYNLIHQVDRKSLLADRKSDTLLKALKNNIMQAGQLRNFLKSAQPDIVISFMTQSNVVCSLACANLKTIHIASERNYPPLQTIGRAWNLLRKYSYRIPKAVVSQTQKTNTWIMNNTKCRVATVIPNPVIYPLPSAAPQNPSAETTTLYSAKNIILGVGRLVDQKQFDHLIRAFSMLTSTHPGWILIIIGDGPNRIKLQQQINALNLQERILLMGRQENMGAWYSQADIFVLTSKFEGYPNALLEAMCYGVAPVSYNCDTGPETIIQHKHNGMLVPPNDEKQLAANIRDLIENPKRRQSVGSNAKKVANDHSLDSIIEQWELLFDQVNQRYTCP